MIYLWSVLCFLGFQLLICINFVVHKIKFSVMERFKSAWQIKWIFKEVKHFQGCIIWVFLEANGEKNGWGIRVKDTEIYILPFLFLTAVSTGILSVKQTETSWIQSHIRMRLRQKQSSLIIVKDISTRI